MKEIQKGTKVRNQYGQYRTVLEIIDDKMVRTYEEPNDLYHITKLYF